MIKQPKKVTYQPDFTISEENYRDSLNEITNQFELKKLKNNYVVGEMLDYDAPTGGYLLQSCFSMGNFLANVLNNSSLN